MCWSFVFSHQILPRCYPSLPPWKFLGCLTKDSAQSISSNLCLISSTVPIMGEKGTAEELRALTTVALRGTSLPGLVAALAVLGCAVILIIGVGVLWFRRSRLRHHSQQVDIELEKPNNDGLHRFDARQSWTDIERADIPRAYQPVGSYNSWKLQRDAREQRYRQYIKQKRAEIAGWRSSPRVTANTGTSK